MPEPGGGPFPIAVTGTNGKTSIASFIAQIATACGRPAAAVGQRIELPGRVLPRDVVPRGRGALAAYFRELGASGIELVACEAYSAAIARGAHRAVRYRCAVFNNLAADHDSVHGSVERYHEAKLSLLDSLPPGTPVVVPIGAVGEGSIEARARSARLELRRPSVQPRGGRSWPEFLTANLAAAAEACLAAGLEQAAVLHAAETVRLPPGRMVRRTLPNGAGVIVDFAHNAHALRAVLGALREDTAGDIHLVFGSKGGWGARKRARMGDVAAELASRVIVTDDDPRREDPARIRSQLRRAHPFRIIADRGTAIRAAMRALRPEDALLVAGRGEDPFFVEAFGRRRFNDLDVVEGEIERRLARHFAE